VSTGGSTPAKVVMYATQWCPYCQRARKLLAARGIVYEEIDIETGAGLRAQMVARSGRTSVPQIFIGDTHVGGSDDLHELDARGGLQPLLASHGH
jgi:glutaredoxin 3